MLNPFPDLLTYSLLAPFILRIVAGFIFINLGFLAFKHEKDHWLSSFSALKIPKPEIALKILGGIEIVGGVMFLLGFYTQIAALVLALLTFAETYIEYKEPDLLKRNLVFYVMLLAIVVSLLFSGAGAFALDLPL
ncbi:MAG: DoxX family protein [Parcubacteria group bacterium]|jgi:putative oxidoreductase|nr:DoxX family protein [Parcubacteria group bacterium]